MKNLKAAEKRLEKCADNTINGFAREWYTPRLTKITSLILEDQKKPQNTTNQPSGNDENNGNWTIVTGSKSATRASNMDYDVNNEHRESKKDLRTTGENKHEKQTDRSDPPQPQDWIMEEEDQTETSSKSLMEDDNGLLGELTQELLDLKKDALEAAGMTESQ